MKSKVYFVEIKDTNLKSRLNALKCLLDAVKPFSSYKKDEIIPIKITIGDSQCIYNLNPELVKLVVSQLKAQKAKPFLFDTNVIYKGERQNAVDHLNLAQSKGFAHTKVGCPYIIADGLFGQDGRQHEVKQGCIANVKIPSFIGLLDNLVVLTHTTGHIISGYAGAIKNVAMGMCSRVSKQSQHSSLKPRIITDKCTSCLCCIKICPAGAISLVNNRAFINLEACIGCGECICVCKFDSVYLNWEEDAFIFCARLVDTARTILSNFKNKFFINFTYDITKECDCISNRNEKIIARDLGILASEDILSLEKATLDLINREEDQFLKSQGKNAHYKMLDYAHEKGLGNIDYNLIRLTTS